MVPQWCFALGALMCILPAAVRARAPGALVAWIAFTATALVWTRKPDWGAAVVTMYAAGAVTYMAASNSLTSSSWRMGMVVCGLAMAGLIFLEVLGAAPWPWNPGLSPGATMRYRQHSWRRTRRSPRRRQKRAFLKCGGVIQGHIGE